MEKEGTPGEQHFKRQITGRQASGIADWQSLNSDIEPMRKLNKRDCYHFGGNLACLCLAPHRIAASEPCFPRN